MHRTRFYLISMANLYIRRFLGDFPFPSRNSVIFPWFRNHVPWFCGPENARTCLQMAEIFNPVTFYSLVATAVMAVVAYILARILGAKKSRVDQWILFWLTWDAIIHFCLVGLLLSSISSTTYVYTARPILPFYQLSPPITTFILL